MEQAERVAIEQRLGRFATMSAADVAAWFEQKEAERVASAAAVCEGRGAHILIWQSSNCLCCGAGPEEF